MYADYNYYLNGYSHGKPVLIDEMNFPAYSQQASVRMDYLTWGRITDSLAETVEVRSCCCKMAEAIYRYEQARSNVSGAPVSSWSNDGESGSFDMSSSVVTEEGHNRLIGQIARQYLLRFGILYRRC